MSPVSPSCKPHGVIPAEMADTPELQLQDRNRVCSSMGYLASRGTGCGSIPGTGFGGAPCYDSGGAGDGSVNGSTRKKVTVQY